jgi:hypothetical protein
MPDPLSRRRRRTVTIVALILLTGALAAAALGGRGQPAEDDWTRLVRTGDTLARVGGRMDAGSRGVAGLTARTAYLLAFHAAQDAMRADRMEVVAQRLDALGERDLARHVRRASSALLPAG